MAGNNAPRVPAVPSRPSARWARVFTIYVVVLMAGAAVALGALVEARFTGDPMRWSGLAVLPPALATVLIVLASLGRGTADRIGPADLVTVFRAALVSVVAGWAVLVLLGDAPAVSWLLTALATTALVLDGVDGAVARRSRSTRAGAALDAETDAVMTLALSLVVAATVGWWVVLAGALRYLFALGVAVRPTWRGPLPALRSRRAVAAWSSGILAACTAPLLAGLAPLLAGAALALLLWSFGGDVVRLERRSPGRLG